MSTPQTKSIWLVGAKGMLGSALAERLIATRARVLMTDRELDITDKKKVLEYAKKESPGLIINAAGYTRVDDAEAHQEEAFKVNGEGPAHLAEAAASVGARLLHFSTDYVFDGQATAPYAEQASPGATSVYGKSKHVGERRVLDRLPEAGYVLRTSWLFGENGPNFVKTLVGLMREKEEVRVVDDQHGRPTYTRDLAAVALSLVGADRRGAPERIAPPGIYHFANAEPTTWHGFTVAIREACQALGVELAVKTIQPVGTIDFPRPAPRPAFSVLDTGKLEGLLGLQPRPFRAALREYLERDLAPSEAPSSESSEAS